MIQKCSRLYSTETLLDSSAEKTSKRRTALTEAANFALLATLLSLYILFDSEKKEFLVLSERDWEFAAREQSHHPLRGKDAARNEADVDSGLWTRNSALDDTLRFVNFPYLDHFTLDDSGNTFYKMQESWTEVAKCAL